MHCLANRSIILAQGQIPSDNGGFASSFPGSSQLHGILRKGTPGSGTAPEEAGVRRQNNASNQETFLPELPPHPYIKN